jgi:hypothetical protein
MSGVLNFNVLFLELQKCLNYKIKAYNYSYLDSKRKRV